MPSPRPPLPLRHANPHIQSTISSGALPPVKYQILNCQGQDILVGRLKIETPTSSGHAFILRRFDTGAVSLTTMFRAAFPLAPDQDEKNEVQWVRENHDLTGNNGSTKDPHITRLAGTWVSPSLALELGKYYSLGAIITAVVEAVPDPNGNYRRSGKAAAAANNATPPSTTAVSAKAINSAPNSKPPSAAKSLPTPSPTAALPNPAKRRKESSPAPVPVAVSMPSPSSKAPLPRRSARTKSPAPPKSSISMAPISIKPVSMSKTPRAAKTIRREEPALTPGGSDETVVDEEGEAVEDDVAGAELREQDIKEQKEMIEDLKKKRSVVVVKKSESYSDQDVPMDGGGTSGVTKLKRVREEEEKLSFDFKEPEVGERAIATNARVSRFRMEPRTRSFAWGVAAFAIGMGAVSFLPNFF